MVVRTTPGDRCMCVSFQPADRDRVDVSDPIERDYWCKLFDVSEVELRGAVASVGGLVSVLQHYFQGRAPQDAPRG